MDGFSDDNKGIPEKQLLYINHLTRKILRIFRVK
jgi:hypothetical protein